MIRPLALSEKLHSAITKDPMPPISSADHILLQPTDNLVPVPYWTFPFAQTNRLDTNPSLTGALWIGSTKAGGMVWTNPILLSFTPDASSTASKKPTSPIPPQLLYLRSNRTDSTGSDNELVVLTRSVSPEGQILLELHDLPAQYTSSPVALRLVNHTPVDLVFSDSQTLLSNMDVDGTPRFPPESLLHLPSHGGSQIWIPGHILNALFPSNRAQTGTDNNSSQLLPFFDVSAFKDCTVRLGCSTVKHSPESLIDVQLASLVASDTYHGYILPRTGHEPLTVQVQLHNNSLLGPSLSISTSEHPHSTVAGTVDPFELSVHLQLKQLQTSLLVFAPIHSLNQSDTHYAPTLSSGFCLSGSLAPPHDEFVRVLLRKLDVSSCYSSYDHRITKLDVVLHTQHIQLDNWAQTWTSAYDFPTICCTTSPSGFCGRFRTSSSLSAPICDLFFSPPEFQLSLEDSLLYDLHALLLSYSRVCTRSQSSCSRITPKHIVTQPPNRLFLQHFFVDRCNLRISLRAMLRLYLSCHEAPLSVSSFDLTKNKTSKSGVAVTPATLGHLLTMHYFAQAMFRAGWLVGSLDVLGNISGLFHSLLSGLNDFVNFRPPQTEYPIKPEHILPSALKSNVVMTSVDPRSNVEYIFLGNSTDSVNSLPGELDFPSQATFRRAALIHRFSQGIVSLTRHATGGLVRSVTGMAASVARNLDYLSLDYQHQQRQEETRRKQVPCGLGEGLQMGLSRFGLSVLGAIAGVADHPLQALFKAMDSDSISTDAWSEASENAETHQSSHLALTALGGLGRGLVGAVVKPMAGVAELVAQTGTGILQANHLGYPSTVMRRATGPYTTFSKENLTQHLTVDTAVLRCWALASIEREYFPDNAQSSGNIRNLWKHLMWVAPALMGSGVVDPELESSEKGEVFWLCAAKLPLLIGAFPPDRDAGSFHLFTLTTNNLEQTLQPNSSSDPHQFVSLYNNQEIQGNDADYLQAPQTKVNMNTFRALTTINDFFWAQVPSASTEEEELTPESDPGTVPAPSDSVLSGYSEQGSSFVQIGPRLPPSRWQRVKEYILSTKTEEPITI